MKRSVRLISILVLLCTVAGLTAGAVGKPDLQISKKSVSSGSTIAGTVKVVNRGGSTARATKAALVYATATKPRVLRTFALGRLKAGASRRIRFSVTVPTSVPAGTVVRMCLDVSHRVSERQEGDNCTKVGRAGSAAVSSVPTSPIPFQKDTAFTLNSGRSDYYARVPASYDASHQTPTSLLVWLHGCGGSGSYDIDVVSPGGSQSWISIAVGGRETVCWDSEQDVPLVLAAIDSMRSHFNIDPRRVVLGGFSSGGDLAYRTAFLNSTRFAGVLAENTAPFSSFGGQPGDALTASTSRFHVAHLAHTGDEYYPVTDVRQQIDSLRSRGFPVDYVEQPGPHWDGNTNADLRRILLPHMNDGWQAP